MPASKPVTIEPIPAAQIKQWATMSEGSGLKMVEVHHQISKEIREALRERGVEVFDDALYTTSGNESIKENRIVDDGLSVRNLDLGTMAWSDAHVFRSKNTKEHYVIKAGQETGMDL